MFGMEFQLFLPVVLFGAAFIGAACAWFMGYLGDVAGPMSEKDRKMQKWLDGETPSGGMPRAGGIRR